jgi:hypothetical protein
MKIESRGLRIQPVALIPALILVLTSNVAYANGHHHVTPTRTATLTATPTRTATATLTATPRPTITATATLTATPRPTITATATLTATPHPTITATATVTRTATPSGAPTATPTPSVLKILSPPDGSTLSGVVSVSVQVPGGISLFNVTVDNTYVLTEQKPTSPTTFQFDTTGLQTGVLHNLAIWPYNALCTSLNTASLTFNVLASASTPSPAATPTPDASVQIIDPVDGEILPDAPFTISFQETGTDINLTNVWIDAGYLQSTPPSPSTFVYNPSGLATGELHGVTVKAYDDKCNPVASAHAAFTIP